MPNRHQLRADCRTCGRDRQPGELFSARGRCVECGEGMAIANRRQLIAHGGPLFDHWRQRCLAAFGIATVDAPTRPE